VTYKTYMPKTHQLFCRICKKQNKLGESIIDVFGEVHLECYNKKVITEFLEKMEKKYEGEYCTWEELHEELEVGNDEI